MEPYKVYKVDADQLKGYYGMAFPESRTIWLLASLPQEIVPFVLAHEKYHLDDKAKYWIWREIKANLYAAHRHPIGAMWCIWETITDLQRWRLYLIRFRQRR